MAQSFQNFPNTQVHIPCVALCSSDNQIYHWNTRVQVHLDSMVRFIYFFVRSIFSLKKHVLTFAFVWEVHCPGDNSDLGIGQLSVFREGKLSVFFFEKLIELWAKNRVLDADLFASDRDAHRYDFKLNLVGGNRLVWSIRSVFSF